MGVLLSADVVAHRQGEVGRVAHRPAFAEIRIGPLAIVEVQPTLLTVGTDSAVRPPGVDSHRHLPLRAVRPVRAELTGQARRVVERRVHLVLDGCGEHATEHCTSDFRGLPEEEGRQVDGVGGVVVEAPTPRAALGAPGPSTRPQNHGTRSRDPEVVNGADHATLEQAMHLLKRRHEAEVVTDLGHRLVARSEFDHSLPVVERESQRLLDEHVDAVLERVRRDLRMTLRRRRDDERVGTRGLDQRCVIRVSLEPGVLGHEPRDVRGRVAGAHHLHPGVGSHDRQMREAHSAEPDDSDLDHPVSAEVSDSRTGGNATASRAPGYQ